MTSLIIFILKKYGKQNTHHHHFLHKEVKKTLLIETGPAVTGSRCCGIPATFFLLFCLITFTYLYYVGEANKIK